ncbi:MAG: penicillin-binding transpeptidase domain-containing protein [Terracidiphilus sp.]|jgi:membrane carboxypeptidase/penicillin-binding protein
MAFTRIWASALVLMGLGLSTVVAAALDAPRPVHHEKTTDSHLTEAHRTTSHHSAAHAAPHAATPTAHKSAAAQTGTTHSTTHTGTAHTTAAHAAPAGNTIHRAATGSTRTGARRTTVTTRRHRYHERFTASSYAKGDIFADDATDGEDPVVRQAAINAMGDMNGTAVVINPTNGRILAMVNQKLALSPGAEPCSTIKLTVALAALSEGLVTRDTPVKLAGFRMNMTQALAKSNNLYFEELGRELGFERVHQYASQFGLGELAGYNIEGEQLGVYPDEELPASQGGVGRMCSFGEGVSLTPLQLGAFVAALANGGTLYYLQHPTTPEEAVNFEPKIKRTLDIARYVPDLQDGMAGAVEYGTARRLKANFHEMPVFGKTGTCSAKGTRFGWFASWADSPQGSLVTVFFLEGGRPTFGPRAAEMTGEFYQNLWDSNWFASNVQQNSATVWPASSQQEQAQP